MEKVDVYCFICTDWAAEVDEDKADANYLCYDCQTDLELREEHDVC